MPVRQGVPVEILLNGQKTKIEGGLTLKALLERFQIDPFSVVVERNEEIVPSRYFTETPLSEGDKIEIVRFVGGGA
ncbi:MAG: sulfur carrier protein ThiS [Candidatus Omnitrophica bacterium]|nr:sulfur carrier protein ThiS [Candidatus Omnitrophota bacterium]